MISCANLRQQKWTFAKGMLICTLHFIVEMIFFNTNSTQAKATNWLLLKRSKAVHRLFHISRDITSFDWKNATSSTQFACEIFTLYFYFCVACFHLDERWRERKKNSIVRLYFLKYENNSMEKFSMLIWKKSNLALVCSFLCLFTFMFMLVS